MFSDIFTITNIDPVPRGLSTTFHPILVIDTCMAIYGRPIIYINYHFLPHTF